MNRNQSRSKILEWVLLLLVLSGTFGSWGPYLHLAVLPVGLQQVYASQGASSVVHNNEFPTRMAFGPNGVLYVTDAKTDSVFCYDDTLNLIGEIKGLDCPLGVAVASDGRIYVGNDGCDNIIVLSEQGSKIGIMGCGVVKMPNDLALDRDNRLYVADSLSNKIWIFDTDGSLAGEVGAADNSPGHLSFPAAITIAYREQGGDDIGELYVADQGHGSVQVFDLQGHHLRAYGGRVPQKMGATGWHGKFSRIQSLAMGPYDRLHVVDCHLNRVQILDPDTGQFLGSYGEFGSAAGQMVLPLDVAIKGHDVFITNAANKRVEVVYTIP